MSKRDKGLAFAFTSAVLFGILPVLGKKIVANFPPLFVAFAISMIAGVYLGTVALWRGELHSFLRKEIVWVVLIGFFATLGYMFAFFGLSIGKASEAGFFYQFETFFATLLAYVFLKETLTRQQVQGLILMFLGAYVFSSTAFGFSFRTGNLFFLAAAFVWGANNVIVRSKVRTLSPFFIAFGRNFFSSIFLLPFALRYIPENVTRMQKIDVYHFLIYGLLVTVLLLCLYAALKYVKTAEATAFQLLIPIITSVIAFFTLGEGLGIMQLVGGAFILGGLFPLLRGKSKLY